MNIFLRLLIVALLALGLAAPAAAAGPTGSAAWSGGKWVAFDGTLYAGPGKRYDVVGSVEDGQRVRVDRCSKRWCSIRAKGERGWISIDQLNFGQHPVKRIKLRLH